MNFGDCGSWRTVCGLEGGKKGLNGLFGLNGWALTGEVGKRTRETEGPRRKGLSSRGGDWNRNLCGCGEE